LSLLVGLTGGMGSGKTLASSYFRNLGSYIIDADLICQKLVEPNQPAFNDIIVKFGHHIIDQLGNLNRKKLAELVFCDSVKRKELENILHPRVFDIEKKQYKNICKNDPNALVIVDAALLIESGNYKIMDKVVVISANEKIRIKRILSTSHWSYDEVIARLNNQMPSEEKIKYADFVLDNSLDKTHLNKQVNSLFTKLNSIAKGYI